MSDLVGNPEDRFSRILDHLYVYVITVKHTGNLSFDDILKIAKQMRERSMAKNMTGTVKEVLGMTMNKTGTCIHWLKFSGWSLTHWLCEYLSILYAISLHNRVAL